MATKPMKKMNKSHKKKLAKLAARQKNHELLTKRFGASWALANKYPGAVK